jgi:hypothetical protein
MNVRRVHAIIFFSKRERERERKVREGFYIYWDRSRS